MERLEGIPRPYRRITIDKIFTKRSLKWFEGFEEFERFVGIPFIFALIYVYIGIIIDKGSPLQLSQMGSWRGLMVSTFTDQTRRLLP